MKRARMRPAMDWTGWIITDAAGEPCLTDGYETEADATKRKQPDERAVHVRITEITPTRRARARAG